MMLLSVKKATAIDANHPELHEHVVDFALAGTKKKRVELPEISESGFSE